MKTNKLELTIDQGMGGNWFVRIDGKLIAGFVDKEDAELYDTTSKVI